MCVTTATALTLAATAAATAGVVQAGRVSAANAESRGRVAERQSRLEQTAAAFDIQREQDRTQRNLGRATSQFAASGVGPGGSVQDVATDIETESNLDIGAIRFGADVRSQNLDVTARTQRENARQSRIGAGIGAVSTLLSGGATAADTQRRTGGDNTFLRSAFAR